MLEFRGYWQWMPANSHEGIGPGGSMKVGRDGSGFQIDAFPESSIQVYLQLLHFLPDVAKLALRNRD